MLASCFNSEEQGIIVQYNFHNFKRERKRICLPDKTGLLLLRNNPPYQIVNFKECSSLFASLKLGESQYLVGFTVYQKLVYIALVSYQSYLGGARRAGVLPRPSSLGLLMFKKQAGYLP